MDVPNKSPTGAEPGFGGQLTLLSANQMAALWEPPSVVRKDICSHAWKCVKCGSEGEGFGMWLREDAEDRS